MPLQYGLPWLPVALLPAGLPGTWAFGLVALYNLLGIVFVVRMVFRRWPAHQTAQVRWFGLGFAAANFGTMLFGLSAVGVLPESWADFGEAVPYNLIFLGCIAVALLRYRLFDIDVILNRTLVYGGLTAGVVGLYALVVGGMGQLLQLQNNVGISLFATGLIAALFNPLRQHLQRAANRLLYGERDEPYRVLSRLSERVDGTLEPAKVLPTMTETVAQALKLPYAAALLNTGGATEQVASYGSATYGSATGNWVALPLTHQGETIGELRLGLRAGDTFKPAELRLLKTIAQQASVAAFAVKQHLELQRSREALVTAREEERRRLRRDLHDGLGPTLASIAMRLDAARNLAHTDPAAADGLLLTLKTQTQATLGDIRRLVYALRPPALDELGLVGALREEVRRYEGTGLNISFCGPDALPTLSAAAEVAVYCTLQEALANVTHHAGARCVRVTLGLCEGGLELSVSDDGIGLAPVRHAGVGLSSMRERAEELGGSFALSSNPAGGTTVRTWLPLPRGTESV